MFFKNIHLESVRAKVPDYASAPQEFLLLLRCAPAHVALVLGRTESTRLLPSLPDGRPQWRDLVVDPARRRTTTGHRADAKHTCGLRGAPEQVKPHICLAELWRPKVSFLACSWVSTAVSASDPVLTSAARAEWMITTSCRACNKRKHSSSQVHRGRVVQCVRRPRRSAT